MLTGTLPVNLTNYLDAACSPSMLYYYRVNCSNAGGASAYAVVSVTTPAGVGDGQDNLAEYLAGTDPTNSASAFQILSIAPQGDGFLITWQTAAGKTNAVEAGNSTTNCADILGLIVTTGTQTNCTDANGATNVPPRFYRVRLVQ